MEEAPTAGPPSLPTRLPELVSVDEVDAEAYDEGSLTGGRSAPKLNRKLGRELDRERDRIRRSRSAGLTTRRRGALPRQAKLTTKVPLGGEKLLRT